MLALCKVNQNRQALEKLPISPMLKFQEVSLLQFGMDRFEIEGLSYPICILQTRGP